MESDLNVLLIDDHPLFRKALIAIINELVQSVIVHEASTVREAFSIIDQKHSLNLVLLDLNLPDANGLKTLLPICQLLDDTPIVVISANENLKLIVHALNSCAKGYIPKSSDSTEIRNALALVLNGGVFIPPIVLDLITRTPMPDSSNTSLTKRQDEVLQLLARGLSNKQISHTLGIAETTVRVHVSDIIQLFNAHNRTDAVIQAQQLGFVNSLS